MSQKNDFKAFSISNNANVVSQRLYEESKDLLTGFPPNDVSTHMLNKALRQSSTISSVLADFIAEQSGEDVLDDGNVAKLTTQLNKALERKTTTRVPDASLTQKGVVQLTNVIGNSDTLAVTQKLVQEIVTSLSKDINDSKANDIPVGTPIPWPTAIPPSGWLQCNGATFDKSKFPELAKAYPSGRLPDLRGEFIRGWDDGRGVDPNRSLLKWQEGSYLLQEGGQGDYVLNFSLNNLEVLQWDAPQNKTLSLRARVARPISTWNDTRGSYIGVSRPRNVAFNYIVRAI
ncbi:Phage Tail Collar Domain protein [Photorhabdus australis subsp. thailandensis]|uniref:Phage Tail Collar Domain protein n=1 Tax=Photorhabdus australis subsp. thailandensis TaxID=2805096 RepID=A0A1C0U450_9GAMM|nr:tail fiber protein [Photorhabdus australis]OCQ52671.1 Phage Tail Collar Domain protein [Photorhabdus australis subsp. thailandensis]